MKSEVSTVGVIAQWSQCLCPAMNPTSELNQAGSCRLPICHQCFWKQSKGNWVDDTIKLERIIGFGLLFKD